MSENLKTFEVWLRSVPGMYEQYNGKVKVYAKDEEEAVDRALDRLRRGAFPDRDRSMWRVEKIELVSSWGF